MLCMTIASCLCALLGLMLNTLVDGLSKVVHLSTKSYNNV